MAAKSRDSVKVSERDGERAFHNRLRQGMVTLAEPIDDSPPLPVTTARAYTVPPSADLTLGRMAETNGGSALENVPGFNAARARSVDLMPRSVMHRVAPARSADGFILENVIGAPDLVPVPDITAIPWRCIAMLTITYENGARATGTAWFMGEKALGTAGHNIRHNDHGHAQEILVSPAYAGNTAVFDTFRVAQTYCDPARLAGNFDPSFDYGVLLLDDPRVGQRLGWFGFAAYDDRQLARLLVNVSGYPAEYHDRVQHYNGGRIKDVSSQFLHYTFDTVGGMSGAPIFALFGEQRIVVGIHTAGSETVNRARRIDQPLYQLLSHFAAA